jgi:uncharacterized protein YbjT (DUF2867 family)
MDNAANAMTHDRKRSAGDDPAIAGRAGRQASAVVPPGATLLLTGATGFVGQALWPALERAGYEVRGLTRDAGAARRRWPDRRWVQADLDAAGDLVPLLHGCAAAIYLVHSMRGGRPDFRRREVEQAARFAAAAAGAGMRRVVYLGGVAPAAEPSEHLRSRLEVGEVLRAGVVPAIELRASMIVGEGSVSWMIVRDLAARLPAMALPHWLRSRTDPVAVDDVVAALVGALALPLAGSAWFDLPGPDRLTGRAILEQTAEVLALPAPLVVEVPLVSPWLSSHWVRLVTRADWAVARELVLGLQGDLVAQDERYWTLIDHRRRISFREAAWRALECEARLPRGPGGAVEWLAARRRRERPPAAAV